MLVFWLLCLTNNWKVLYKSLYKVSTGQRDKAWIAGLNWTRNNLRDKGKTQQVPGICSKYHDCLLCIQSLNCYFYLVLVFNAVIHCKYDICSSEGISSIMVKRYPLSKNQSDNHPFNLHPEKWFAGYPVKSTLFFSEWQKHLIFARVATWEKAGFHKVNQKKMGAMP